VPYDRDSIYVNSRDIGPEDEAGPDRQREYVLANIKAALVTSRLTLSTNNAGVDPYNSRLGRRPKSAWQGRGR
jgi:hypothetical protein